MSIQSWKAKYYPISAADTLGFNAKDTINHSIRKWKGLRKSKLRKHEVAMTRHKMSDAYGAISIITADECSLCVKYDTRFCSGCPIVEVTGKRCHEDWDSPWSIMNDTGNPKPMIKLLKRVRREMQK